MAGLMKYRNSVLSELMMMIFIANSETITDWIEREIRGLAMVN